jgi:hypothetical protein
MAEELWAVRSGEMTIEISGLSAGTYSFTGVFNDSFDNNSAFAGGNNIDILLTDANNAGATIVSGVDPSWQNNGNTGNPVGPITTSTFGFEADGINDVSIVLDAGSGFVPLSGFTVIPEPGTYALIAGLAGLGLALVRRRARS